MKELESARPRPELRARILASLPATPPAPGIRVVHSRPDRERSPQFSPRLALAGGLVMLLAFSSVFALKHASTRSGSGMQDAAASVRPSLRQNAQEQASSDGNPSVPGALDMVTYTPEEDPNNARADQMFHEQMTGIEREQRLLGQDDWHRLLAQARAVAQNTDHTATTSIGIALAVPNIAAVRTHLPTWARQEGATYIVGGRAEPASAEKTALPSLRDEDPRANTIAFYVPVQRGPAFLGALKQLGQISALSLASRPMAVRVAQSETQDQSEPNSDNQRRAIPIAPIAADAAITPEKSIVVHEKRPKSERYLVLTVLLTATHD